MRFLHTSDWHLGKVLHEKSLIEDQKHFLEQVKSIILDAKKQGKPYTAILVPGDIYDRVLPPQDACELFSNFLADMNEAVPELHMFFTSGNHDSASRLSYGATIFKRHNIHFITNTKAFTEPVILEDEKGVKVAVYSLPYLTPLSIESSDPEEKCRSQEALYKEACTQILSAHRKNNAGVPSVLCAHLYTMGTLGTVVSKSERSFVGTAEQVGAENFKDFTYGAFGHIHKCQPCDGEHKLWYSGSPLAYNMDDSPETFFLDVEISSCEAPAVIKIPVKPLHPVVRLEGKLNDFTVSDGKWTEYKDCFVHITLTDAVKPLGAHSLLLPVFPGLMQIEMTGVGAGEDISATKERKQLMTENNPEKIFDQFIHDIYGEVSEDRKELVEKEKNLFKSVAEEIKWGK